MMIKVALKSRYRFTHFLKMIKAYQYRKNLGGYSGLVGL